MFVMLFLLWLLMTGEVSVHACLWGLVVSAAMTWFWTGKVSGLIG